MYIATENDLRRVLQKNQKIVISVDFLDEHWRRIGNASGKANNLSLSIDSESDIRRTVSLDLVVCSSNMISPDGNVWIDKYAQLDMMLFDYKTNDYWTYHLGKYVIKQYSLNTQQDSMVMSLQLQDLMSLFTEDRGNQITTETSIPVTVTLYPCPECGENMVHTRTNSSTPIMQNGVVVVTDTSEDTYTCSSCSYTTHTRPESTVEYADITNALVSTVRRFSPLPYDRFSICELTADSSEVPYDLNYDIGTYPIEIINDLVGLYPNYQAYFDNDGVFTFDEIPSDDDDPIVLDKEFMDKIIISEEASGDFGDVCNVHDVWGRLIEADRTAEVYTYSVPSQTQINYTAYISSLPMTETYIEGTREGERVVTLRKAIPVTEIGKHYYFIPPVSNSGKTHSHLTYIDKPMDDWDFFQGDVDYLRSGVYSLYPIYHENADGTFSMIKPNDLLAETPYIVWLRPVPYTNNTLAFQFVLEGEPQIRAVVITVAQEPTSNEKQADKEYFACNNIYYQIEPDNIYAADLIGKKIKACHSGDYDNIYSVELAYQRGRYENYKSTRLCHSVTLTTLIVPWLDVNQKIRYTSPSTNEVKQYIIKKIDFDYSNGSMTLTLTEFYPYYPFETNT